MNINILRLPQETIEKFLAAGVTTTQQLENLTQSKLLQLGLELSEVQTVRSAYKRMMNITGAEESQEDTVITVKQKQEESPEVFATYDAFDQTLQTELRKSAEGFVRIGYLLKLARDTDILQESGFTSVAEYAKEKYGLSKDVVSRYININDKFSEDGNSPRLKEQYQGYGIAKLQEMLTMPEEVLGLLTPQLTKNEINEVKKEVEEEKAVTPLEVMAEEMEIGKVEGTMLQQAWKEYFHKETEQFCRIWESITAIYSAMDADALLDIIEPSGVGVKTVRIKGVGKLLISIKGKDFEIEMMNIRTGEKEMYKWTDIIRTIADLIGSNAKETAKETWETIYEEPYPEKARVAPVQQQEEEQHADKRQEPARRDAESIATEQEDREAENKSETKNEASRQQEEADSEEKVAEQVPGQTEITKDFPELCPQNVEKTERDTIKEPYAEPSGKAAAVHEITENVVQEGTTVREVVLSGDEEKIRKAIIHKFGQQFAVDTVWNTWMEMIINA